MGAFRRNTACERSFQQGSQFESKVGGTGDSTGSDQEACEPGKVLPRLRAFPQNRVSDTGRRADAQRREPDHGSDRAGNPLDATEPPTVGKGETDSVRWTELYKSASP